MKYIFYTKNIEPALYKKLVFRFLFSTMGRNYRILDTWKFEFYPSTMASMDPNFHGVDGVGGVTGMGVIKFYVEDAKTPLADLFQRVFRRNSLMITHELCHAIFIQQGRSQKVALRNDDYSGHKAGQLLNFSTAEVHDRHIEKKFYTLSFLKIISLFPKRMTCQVLDIRDLV